MLIKQWYMGGILFFSMILSISGANLSDLDPSLLSELAGTKGSQIFKPSQVEEVQDVVVDHDTYFIGPGDEFFITSLDAPSTKYFAKINQQCDLYIPDWGIIKLGRITLSQAQDSIVQFMRTRMRRNADIYITLSKVKMSTFTVLGAVAQIGTHRLPGTSRLLDALKMANGGVVPSINELVLRNIEYRFSDTTMHVDLLKYLLTGDPLNNPYLYPGAEILMPVARQRVFLGGAIRGAFSGNIPIRDGETLEDLVSLFSFDASADTSRILYRSGETVNSQTVSTIPRDRAADIVLHDQDMIVIPRKENYSQQHLVNVAGEVLRPGAYPFIKKTTTVRDILALAGGITEMANKQRIAIARRSKFLPRTQQALPFSQGALLSEISSIRPEINSAMRKINITNDYALIPVKGDGSDITLEENDNIIVPATENLVYISGNVKHPGAYPFVSGKNMKYYIRKAGGYTPKAAKSNCFVISTYQEITQIKDVRTLNDGDIIVVPDSQELKVFSVMILPIFQATVTAITLILAIINTR